MRGEEIRREGRMEVRQTGRGEGRDREIESPPSPAHGIPQCQTSLLALATETAVLSAQSQNRTATPS